MLLTVFALVLFAQERFRIETSSLFVFVLLVVGVQVFPYEGARGALVVRDLFNGFGHEALIAVCALMILGKGLESTGALKPVARLLARLWRLSPAFSLLFTMVTAAILSAFVNNTPIVVMLLPLLVGVTLSANQAPSKVLMPFGLATVIGGAVTTIGTSTNLLVVSVAHDLGVRHFGMFDFAMPMALVGMGGVLFLWLLGPRLLPVRQAPMGDQSALLFNAILHVNEKSKIAGKTLAQARKMTDGELKLVDVQRGLVMLVRLPSLTFLPGDRLHVIDTPARIKELERAFGVSLHRLDDPPVADQNPDDMADGIASDQQRLVEVVVTEQSLLANSSLKQARFADEFGLFVLAIHRGGVRQDVWRKDLAKFELKAGDVMLVQGDAGNIARLKSSSRGLLVLDSIVDLPNTSKAPLALAIMIVVIALAAGNVLPIAVSALIGVGAMLASRCMNWAEAMRGLSVPVVLIVVTSLALGTALIATGGTDYLAKAFVALTDGMSPHLILAGLMLLMALLTNILSNNAAGIIGTPIAVSIAAQLGLDPVPFVVAIIAGVNLSFATPMAYQTNLLVMNAGGYRFLDFARVGIPLTLLMLAGYTLIIPSFFPL
jgi:di/tricarboxylate transporter